MELFRPVFTASSLSARRISSLAKHPRPYPLSLRCIHQGIARNATPIAYPAVPGQPPGPPQVSPEQPEDRIARKRRQAELLQRGKEARINPAKPASALQKRFWKQVSVKAGDDGLQIMLDNRPVRTATKQVLSIPQNKRALATGIALEWDNLVSAQQALKQHYIPLTSLTARALDIQKADADGQTKLRDDLVSMLMRYLGTDTLLCWAPEKDIHQSSGLAGSTRGGDASQSLRQTQIAVAEPIIGFLKTHTFPGVDIAPVLDEDSIVPKAQPQLTQEVMRGWLYGLPAFELAAMERAVLATKSFLVGARLLVEWSRELRRHDLNPSFGIKEAADACSVEVTWQTNMWGEVEDTHDVEREDLARQLGSVILLVS